MDCRTSSLESLLRLSVGHGLVTSYRVSPARILLFCNEERVLIADPEETRLFLQGLLIGYSMAKRLSRGTPAEIGRSRND